MSLHNGQVFSVRGKIDTSLSKAAVKDYRVVLREKVLQISEHEHTNRSKNDTVLYDPKDAIYLGTGTDFSVEVKIPENIAEYTAIGNIISRAYFLVLIAEVNCCYSNPTVVVHGVLNNNNAEPELEEADQIQPP